MKALGYSAIVFCCIFAGALVGMFVRTLLPEKHLTSNSTDVMKLATGLVVTMTSLVLGMLVSSALTFYNLQKSELQQVCAKVILLDRLLAEYGEDTRQARSSLRETVVIALGHIWPEDSRERPELKPASDKSSLYQNLQSLDPKTDQQRSNKQQALNLATELYQSHWLIFIESGGGSAFAPLLVIILSWLTGIFLSFGLLAQRNATVTVTLLCAALAVSAAFFIIMEMYDPYAGMLKISSTPFHYVLDQIGH